MLLLVKKLWNFEKVEIFSGKTLTNFLWEKLDFWLFFGGGGVSILFSTKTWHLLFYVHVIFIAMSSQNKSENKNKKKKWWFGGGGGSLKISTKSGDVLLYLHDIYIHSVQKYLPPPVMKLLHHPALG